MVYLKSKQNNDQFGQLIDKPTATDSDKASLTTQALNLFNTSKSAPSEPLRGQIRDALAKLEQYKPWTDTSHWYSLSTWHDSQTVRSNLQQALENVNIATKHTTSGEQVSSTWRPQTEAMAPVSVTDEFIKNVPGEIANATSCAAKGMRYDGEKCIPALSCDALPGPIAWICNNPGKSIAIGGGIALLIVLAILRPYITIFGQLSERKNKKFKKNKKCR